MKIRLSDLRKIIKEALAPHFLVIISSKYGPSKTYRYETLEAALVGYKNANAELKHGETAELKRMSADGEETWSPSWKNFPSEVLPSRR